MRRYILSALALTLLSSPVVAQTHLNPLVDLLAAKKPLFGVYAPSNRRNAPAETQKTPAQLVQEGDGGERDKGRTHGRAVDQTQKDATDGDEDEGFVGATHHQPGNEQHEHQVGLQASDA